MNIHIEKGMMSKARFESTDNSKCETRMADAEIVLIWNPCFECIATMVPFI